MDKIEESILATLHYYDIFDYPLTSFEIWMYLVSSNRNQFKISVGDVVESLFKSETLGAKISQRDGFYFLFGRADIVDLRLKRKKLADQKWKKARKIFRLLEVVPFMKAIFVSGSLAMENSKDDSDIDVIVVAKKSRIWTVRTLLTLLTFALGVRRHGGKTKDRICLNHYITDASLEIPFVSLYNAESYVHLVNVYRDDNKVFRAFQKENMWIRKFVCNFDISQLGSTRSMRRSSVLRIFRQIIEFFLAGRSGDLFEKLFESLESRHIKNDPLYQKAGGRVTIDENQLEFHPDSHEQYIIPEFNSRMERLGFMDFAGQKDSGLN